MRDARVVPSLVAAFLVGGCSAIYDGSRLRGQRDQADSICRSGAPHIVRLVEGPRLVFDGGDDLVAAYLDGDRQLDLALVDPTAGEVRVLGGLGDGAFHPPVSYKVGVTPRGLVAADFDSDGAVDLAVSNEGSNSISVLMNPGDGTFSARFDLQAGSAGRRLAAVDLDGDGRRDLALVNGDGSVSILLNTGRRADPFVREAFRVRIASGGYADAAFGRVGPDKAPDLLTLDGGLSVWTNMAASFGSQATYPAGQGVSLAAGDLDGDGLSDAVMGVSPPSQLELHLNRGGAFTGMASSYLVDELPLALALCDFDGDGRLDVVNSNFFAQSLSLRFGEGDGRLRAGITWDLGHRAFSFAVGDFDGDRTPDLAVLMEQIGGPTGVEVVVLRNLSG